MQEGGRRVESIYGRRGQRSQWSGRWEEKTVQSWDSPMKDPTAGFLTTAVIEP